MDGWNPIWLEHHPLIARGLATLFVLAAMAVFKGLLNRAFRARLAGHPDDLRRWMVSSRNVMFLVALLLVAAIWASELRTLALSAVAFAAALVLATKELVMCVLGGFYRTITRSFALGDRIEVAGLRGDVIDETLLSTRLLEVGPGPNSHQYTGRAISIPNSVLLTQSVLNETFTADYVLHILTIPIRAEDDWERAEGWLLEAANQECAAWLADATAHLYRISDARGLARPSVEPRVVLQIPEPGRIHLQLRFPVAARNKGRAEQSVLRAYLALRASEAQPAS